MGNENLITVIMVLLGIALLSLITGTVVVIKDFLKYVKLNRKYKDLGKSSNNGKSNKEELRFTPVPE